MALYFPKQRVALNFVDVPEYNPNQHDDEHGWSVLEVSTEEFLGWNSYRQLMTNLGHMLHHPATDGPDWDETIRTAREKALTESLAKSA